MALGSGDWELEPPAALLGADRDGCVGEESEQRTRARARFLNPSHTLTLSSDSFLHSIVTVTLDFDEEGKAKLACLGDTYTKWINNTTAKMGKVSMYVLSFVLFRFLPAFFPPSFGFTSPTSSTPLHTHAVRPWLAQVPTPPYLCALRRAAAAVIRRRVA